MRTLCLVMLLVACRGPTSDPVLGERRAALDAWKVGKAALEAGQSRTAREQFDLALSHRPGDPLLLAWRAQAEAADGELPVAIATLTTALAKEPTLAEARYNLAAYQARTGDIDAAAATLAQALQDGAASPRDVLGDPDFQPHLLHPALAYLPKGRLDVAVQGPDGRVFLGGEARVAVTVTGPDLRDVPVRGGGVRAPFALARVEETLVPAASGEQTLSVVWSLRTMGAGQLEVGPFVVGEGARSVQAPALTLLAGAPPGHQMPAVRASVLASPSALSATAPAAVPAVAAWVHDGQVHVRAGPVDEVSVEGVQGLPVQGQHLDGRDVSWVLRSWPDPEAEVRVRVVREGKTLLDGPPVRP